MLILEQTKMQEEKRPVDTTQDIFHFSASGGKGLSQKVFPTEVEEGSLSIRCKTGFHPVNRK